MTAAIESRVPYHDYVQRRGVSITRLKELKRSPLHYQHRLHSPYSSGPLTLGTAAHCATLEPERFAKEFAVWERRTEGGAMAPRKGQYWDAFQTANAGKTLLTIDEKAEAIAISEAVRGSAPAMKYLSAGEPEVTMEWEMCGRQCRGRVDWLTVIDGMPVLVGLKTARDCRPFQFGRQAAQLEYAQQWAWYYNGYHALTGRKALMIEIVVESAPPYAVATYRITDDIILQGEEEYGKLLTILDRCEASHHWPGPVEDEIELTLPTWYYGSNNDDVADLGLITE